MFQRNQLMFSIELPATAVADVLALLAARSAPSVTIELQLDAPVALLNLLAPSWVTSARAREIAAELAAHPAAHGVALLALQKRGSDGAVERRALAAWPRRNRARPLLRAAA